MSSIWKVALNSASPVSKLIQRRRFQDFCTGLNWNKGGLYRSVVYAATYQCPITAAVPNPANHPSTASDEIPTRLSSSPMSGVASPSMSESIEASQGLSGAATAAIVLALVLAFVVLIFALWWCRTRRSFTTIEQAFKEERRRRKDAEIGLQTNAEKTRHEDAQREGRENAERRRRDAAERQQYGHQSAITYSTDSYHTARSQYE